MGIVVKASKAVVKPDILSTSLAALLASFFKDIILLFASPLAPMNMVICDAKKQLPVRSILATLVTLPLGYQSLRSVLTSLVKWQCNVSRCCASQSRI